MIKRIHKIKNFGVYEDYQRSGDIRDFEDKNIIYGWNYSGKTTLSRFFSYLNKDAAIEDDYKNIEFEVELDNGTKINDLNRLASPLQVKVFNSDFVRDNLHYETDKRICGIKFAVGEVGDILKQIGQIDVFIEKANRVKQRNAKNTTLFNGFESKFTEVARHLTELLSLGRNFTKSNIRSYVQQWNGKKLEDFIISDGVELESVSTNAKAQNTGSIISINHEPSAQYDSLFKQVAEILHQEPKASKEDELLSSNRELYNWARTGLDIYNKMTDQQTKCAFCGGTITKNERLAFLNAYYTNEASKVKSKIEQLKSSIQVEKQKFDNLEWSNKSENDLAQSCRASYLEKKQSYAAIRDAYQLLLDTLVVKLDEKYEKSLFVSIEVGEINVSANEEMKKWISSVTSIFEKSNEIINEFKTTQDNAKQKFIKHYVAKFLIDQQYRKLEKKKDNEAKWNGMIDKWIRQKTEEKRTLDEKIESIEKGKDELNDFIKLFLGRDDLKIEVTNDNFFVLKRDGKIANNLSEGEKTAIAFSHFMVLLKSLKDKKKLQDFIIFIDDPISSLDANHIAQVSSMLNTFFFEKGLDAANPERVCNCFEQLFIATHNFELFSFLKDANNINRRKKVKQGDVPSCNYFMIKKIDVKKSVIINIPKSLTKYKSEYVYLFSEIDKFKNEGFPEDRIYMMPNIIRRFLEIYTLMKLPGNTDEIDNRIKILFSERLFELKILHNFSHFTSFDRVTKHSELVLRIPDIIEDLYKILDADKVHLDSLKEGIR